MTTPTTSEVTPELVREIVKHQGNLGYEHNLSTYFEIAKAYLAFAESQKWQPIETAPKDGTSIIVAAHSKIFQGDVLAALVYYSDVYSKWWHVGRGAIADWNPTYWQHLQPLPTPPSGDAR
jgi:hypothetical protein